MYFYQSLQYYSSIYVLGSTIYYFTFWDLIVFAVRLSDGIKCSFTSSCSIFYFIPSKI